ncbi:putative ATP-dependent endonuclease of the OLD family [Paenibacillus sp. ov031]|uniref:ATP-dependent nuclease n=1 Tax=Paenibacillus sp. ov031 TaxID=1761879 RepID=UPI0009211A0F|nr:AAA family ATPase [Paenibacillus sp. ov031]SHN82360.1 putative ATP-dependent endonuclease of the OLD family [Paenibacillus sp. ov031]
MFLSEVRITNFRKFGEGTNGEPGLVLVLNNGLNVLIGENDAGKSTVVDAIKFVLLTQSREYSRLEKEDFHNDSSELKIECIFKGFSVNQAKDFLEWITIDSSKQYNLRVFLTAKKDVKGKILIDDVHAGSDSEGQIIHSRARDLLRTVYLKPLRDAENELAAKRNSRLSQILYAHPEFSTGEDHRLVEIIRDANKKIKDYFNEDELSNDEKKILKSINVYLSRFSDNKNFLRSNIEIAAVNLKMILEKIDLLLVTMKSGLGSLNQLYIAAELLLLQIEKTEGINLALIEEIEAHLHPQAQIRVIDYLQELSESNTSPMQILLTTHSVTLVSVIKLNNLIFFTEGKAFSLAEGNTKLHKGDYKFLERFLDSTKANFFFAKGVIIVEGDAENLLLPTLADKLGKSFAKNGVSVVNVGSTALLRYSKIFARQIEPMMQLPVAVVTDCDEAVSRVDKDSGNIITIPDRKSQAIKVDKQLKYSDGNIKAYISHEWTLEFDIACSCLKKELFASILMAKDYINQDKALTEGKEAKEYKKISDYLTAAETRISEWSTYDSFMLASNIVRDVVLKKNISKAVVAQCFSEILKERRSTMEELETIRRDIYLKYLVDAIDYVTGA